MDKRDGDNSKTFNQGRSNVEIERAFEPGSIEDFGPRQAQW